MSRIPAVVKALKNQLNIVHDYSSCTDNGNVIAAVNEVDVHWCLREDGMTDLCK